MTDDNSERRIGGLEPRAAAPDLSRLIRRNRSEPSVEGEGTTVTTGNVPRGKQEEEGSSIPSKNSKQALEAAVVANQTAVGQKTAADSEIKRMTVYIASRHYARARAAYRATSYAAHDRSWSDFVEKALVAELERREAEHNAGQPYAPDSTPLSPGRPLSN